MLNRWSNIHEAMRFLNCLEMTPKKKVIHQQHNSIKNILYVGEKKYEIETIVRAFEYFALSRTTYNRIREDFELPSIATLTWLTFKVKSVDDESYLRTVFENLTDERQKPCILLLVYIKTALQYHGGMLFAKEVNNPSVLANTVICFMIVNLFGGPKFLYKMLPVRNLKADFLFNQANSILSSIRSVGGNVVTIICDGNRVNQAFYTKFETISPWRTKEGVFLLFDFVHLLKNIRNNWITEKTQEIEFSMNGENKVAKWRVALKLCIGLNPNQMVMGLPKCRS